MSELEKRVRRIITCINKNTEDLNANERAMVVLFVSKMAGCAVELDIVDTLGSKDE